MFTKLYVHLMSLLALLGGRVRTRVPARGANFIEYALLAVIAVILFAVFNDTLQGVFANVYDRIADALNFNG